MATGTCHPRIAASSHSATMAAQRTARRARASAPATRVSARIVPTANEATGPTTAIASAARPRGSFSSLRLCPRRDRHLRGRIRCRRHRPAPRAVVRASTLASLPPMALATTAGRALNTACARHAPTVPIAARALIATSTSRRRRLLPARNATRGARCARLCRIATPRGAAPDGRSTSASSSGRFAG